MADVKQEELFGSILPNVFISRITLESRGDQLEERNPHIDHEREPDVIRNEETGKIERQILTPDLAKKSEESKFLSITLDLVIKEKFDGSDLSTWFNNQDFLKYFRTKILQSTSVDATAFLSFQQTSLDKDEELISDKATEKFLKRKIIDISKAIKGKKLEDFRHYDDEDGNRIYDITLTERFVIDNYNPEHLAYFVVSYIDVESLAKDNDLDLPSNIDRTFEGRVESELVIDEGETVSESFVFLKENGKIWTGEIHLDEEGRYKTESTEEENSEFLQIKSVPNNKIQDFRNIEEMGKLQLDFSIFENDISQRIQKDFTVNKNLKTSRQRNYFSDLNVSHDSRGNVRFFVALDFLRLAREATLFGKLYREDNKDLLQNVKIRNLILKRVRILDSKNAIENEYGYVPFDKNEEPPQNVIFSGEKENADDELEFFTRETEKGSIQEIDVFLEENNPGLRFFTGTDNEITNFTFGLYKYGIEIEIEDNTTNFISDMVDNLLDAKLLLEEYLAQGSQKLNYNFSTNRFTQKFIKEQEEKYRNNESVSPWSLVPETYINILSVFFKDIKENEKYLKSFVSYIHPRTGNPNGINTFLKQIEELIVKLSEVVGSQISGQITKWAKGESQFKKFSTISKGALPIKSFKIEKYFSNTIDSDVPKNVGFDFLSSEEIELEKNNIGLKVISRLQYEKRTEKETLKFYKTKDPILDLRSSTKTYTKGDSITNSRYSYLTPSFSIPNKGSKPVDLLNAGQKLFDNRRNQNFVSDSLIYSFSKKSPYTPTRKQLIDEKSNLSYEEQKIKDNYSFLFSEKGITLEFIDNGESREETQIKEYFSTSSNALTEDKIQKEFSEKDRGIDKAGRDINPNNFFIELYENLFDSGYDSDFSKTKREQEKRDKKETIQAFNLKESKNLLDDVFNKKNNLLEQKGVNINNRDSLVSDEEGFVSDTKQEAIKQLPNQVKSLFLSSVSPNEVNKNWFAAGNPMDPVKDPNQKLTFKLHYNFINQIEMLVGFERGLANDGSTQIKTPIWKKINIEKINKVVEKNAVCRMVPYSNKELGINFPKSIKLPIYNEYFILSPKEEIVVSPPKPKRPFLGVKTLDNVSAYIQPIALYPVEYTKSMATIKSKNKEKLLQQGQKKVDSIRNLEILKPLGRAQLAGLSEDEKKGIKNAQAIARASVSILNPILKIFKLR